MSHSEESFTGSIPHLEYEEACTQSSFLHGVLDVKIVSVTHLRPLTVGLGSILPGFVSLDSSNRSSFKHVKGSMLSHFPRLGGLSNPFIALTVTNSKSQRKTELARTQCRRNTLNPNYYERFSINLCEEVECLKLTVRDKRNTEDIFMGELCLSNEDIRKQCCSRTGLHGTFPLSEMSVEGIQSINLDRYASKWMKVRTEKRIKYGRYGGRGLGWITIQLRFTKVASNLQFLDKINCEIIQSYKFKVNDSRRNFYFTTDSDSLLNFPRDMRIEDARRIVPSTYFSPHFNQSFSLYVGSHQPGLHSILPEIEMSGEPYTSYIAGSCLLDIFLGLKKAKQFVCISMKTIDVSFELVQTGPGAGESLNIGQILKNLASEGVLVLLQLNKSGKSSAIKKYFKGTRVACLFVEQEVVSHGMKTKFLSQQDKRSDSCFFHDNGYVIFDTPVSTGVKLKVRKKGERPPKVRGVMAFLGGIQFCSESYSDPDKSVFFGKAPIHDVYVRVEDLGAIDCLQVFVESWMRKGHKSNLRALLRRFKGAAGYKRLKKALDRDLGWSDTMTSKKYSIIQEELMQAPKDLSETVDGYDSDDTLLSEGSGEESFETLKFSNSCVQIVRSVDSNSAKLQRSITFPNTKYSGGLKVDNSLEKAVLHLIQGAQKFLYIETDYLISSSQQWKTPGIMNSEDGENCFHNVVVTELIRKVEARMKVGESFHVYLLVSLRQKPISDDCQSMKSTLKLLLAGIDAAAQLYNVSLESYVTLLTLGTIGHHDQTERNRSTLIRIASNLIVVDDSSTFVGAGCLDQKTLDGQLNCALGVVCSDFQNSHTSYVKAFRMALFASHLGAGSMMNDFVPDMVQSPESKECINYIRMHALSHLRNFLSWEKDTKIPSERTNIGYLILCPFKYNSATDNFIKIDEISELATPSFAFWIN